MKHLKLLLIIIFTTTLYSCEELFHTKPPTKTSMEGVWEATMVLNEQNQDIIHQLQFPTLAFHLSSDNTVISTAGPLIMYIVYGPNKYTQIGSQIDQVFNYATLSFNGGEFFIGGGQQDRFTLEMKLEGLPGQKALTTLLEMIGVGNAYLDLVVYHKFMDVKVSFQENYNKMIWEIDEVTTAVYNTKNNHGNYVLWQGWPVNNFQKCKIVFEKRSQDIRSLVQSVQ